MVKITAGQRGTIVNPGGQMGFIDGAKCIYYSKYNLKILVMI
jgi:hypothetical protein